MILLDSHLNIYLQNLGSWLLPIMQFISFIGSDAFYLMFFSAIYWCFDRRLGIRLGVAYLFASTTNSILKLIFQLPRPYWIDPLVKEYASESSFGFPSGHAQMSVAVWGLLGYTRKEKWVKWTVPIIILLIGISRLYLGVHFSADVLAGWILGFLVLLMFYFFDEPITRRLSHTKPIITFMLAILPIVIILGVGMLLHEALRGFNPPMNWITFGNQNGHRINPVSITDLISRASLWFGLAAGACWLMSRTRNSEWMVTAGSAGQKIWRFIIGLAGILFIYGMLGLTFPQKDTSLDLAVQIGQLCLVGFWISGLAPLVFMRTGLVKSGNIKRRKAS